MNQHQLPQKIIISPSGKFYGSEQVLYDYVNFSRQEFSIFVAGRGLLFDKLRLTKREEWVHSFGQLQLFYFKLALLCLRKKIKTIYINEAGHSRYVTLLTRLFPRVNFVIHVRLLEDTVAQRWPRSEKPINLKLISVSKCLQKELVYQSLQLYDPYVFRDSDQSPKLFVQNAFTPLRVAIIGRISITKGIDDILQLLEIIKTKNQESLFQFEFYGEAMPDVSESGRLEKLKSFSNVQLKGFVSDKTEVYKNIDCILHACRNESLGRVFLESIDYEIPFVGIHINGIAEIGDAIDLSQLLVDGSGETTSELLLQNLVRVRENYDSLIPQIRQARQAAKQVFSIKKYSETLDAILE